MKKYAKLLAGLLMCAGVTAQAAVITSSGNAFNDLGNSTVDQKTGHVWVGQNGQDLWEQAYLVQKGANYGWSVTEGSHPFYPDRRRGPTPISNPTVEILERRVAALEGGLSAICSRTAAVGGGSR